MSENNITRQQWQTISDQLRAPFDPADVDFRPQSGKSGGGENKKAQAVCYVESRAIMDRLDDVVGAGNWSFDYAPLLVDKGEVQIAKGTLTILGVSKSDVGEASNFAPSKGCVSDALKRCAVLWGIGRYLYDVPSVWAEVNQWGRFDDATIQKLRAKLPRPAGSARSQAPREPEELATPEEPPAKVTPIRQRPSPAAPAAPTVDAANDADALDLSARTVADRTAQQEIVMRLYRHLGIADPDAMDEWLAKHVRPKGAPRGPLSAQALRDGTSNLSASEYGVAMTAIDEQQQRQSQPSAQSSRDARGAL